MITDHLYKHAGRQADKPFLVFGERDIGYGEMARLVSRQAHRLHQAGVKPGQHVALLCGNRPAFLVSWFAINELGAVAVPLNVSLVGDGLQYTLRQSEAVLLMIEPDLLEGKRKAIEGLGTNLPTVVIDETMEADNGEAVARWQLATKPVPMAANSILYTSGTTGLPKGVVLPHRAYELAGQDMVQSLGVTADERILVFLPLFHANPQMYAVTSTLQAGATLVLLPKFSASQFFADAVHHRATGFTFVGTVLSILEKQHPGDHRAHGLKWCVGGGAPARVWQEVESRFGVKVRELYGMTETGGWVTMNTAPGSRLGTVGLPRRGVEIAVRDPQGNALPVGEKGEITARSDDDGMFFTEYWNNPDATAGTLKHGWLFTGDRGYLDPDGYLYFDGRVKELIRRGGEMIAPTEIEQQLLKHPAVKDCAVVGVPDDIMGEEVKAVIVASETVSPQALQAFLDGRVPAYMVPRFFTFTQAIPKTETQKIKRHELGSIAAETIDTRPAGRAQQTATN